jgi:hypothetical protein
MLMYCVKCKLKTDSLNITETITEEWKWICSICGSKKSTFIKNYSTGSGIGDILINGISQIGELHLPADKGEYLTNVFFNNKQKYSYCGPEQSMIKE